MTKLTSYFINYSETDIEQNVRVKGIATISEEIKALKEERSMPLS